MLAADHEATGAPAGSPARLAVLRGLHLGLPGYWYPVLAAADLGASPRGLRRFGQDLVLWRDSAGGPHAFEDRCSHRAARFSAGAREPGRIRGDTLTCWYHDWAFAPDGRCVARPGLAGAEPGAERFRVRAYPTAERAGFVWLYHGADTPPPLAVPPELEDPAWCFFRTAVRWRTNWLNVMDNLADPLHQYALHGRAYTTRRRPPFNRVRVADLSDERLRLVQYREDPPGTVQSEEAFGFELVLPNRFRGDLLNAAPGGDVRVIMFMTPIDAERTWITFCRGRQVSGRARLHWQAIWHLFYRRAVFRVAGQDRALLGRFGPLDATRGREHLVASDIGVIQFRRLLRRAFERTGPAIGPAPPIVR